MTIIGIWQEKMRKFRPAGGRWAEFGQTSAGTIKKF
jgi:hypothetical protein